MRTLVLDTEFNKDSGQLLSMALVDPEQKVKPFYATLAMIEPLDTWVSTNVIALIHLQPQDPWQPEQGKLVSLAYTTFQQQLIDYLWYAAKDSGRYVGEADGLELFASHANDVIHFGQALKIDNLGNQHHFPPLRMIIDPNMSEDGSQHRHNAYYDCLAMIEDNP